MEKIKKIFSTIYDQNIDKIYRFIYFKVNSKEVAEDLTSEVFVRGWDKFKLPGQELKNPSAFLYQIARNLVVDHYREKGRAQVISTDYLMVDDPKQDLAEATLLKSDMDAVRAVLFELNDDYQNAIIWRYLEEIPIAEISEMMNKSEEATRVTLHRALKALRDGLSNPNQTA